MSQKSLLALYASISSTLASLALINVAIKYGSFQWDIFFVDVVTAYRSLIHKPVLFIASYLKIEIPAAWIDYFVVYLLVGSGVIYMLFYVLPTQELQDKHPKGIRYGLLNRLILVLYRLIWPVIAIWAIVGIRRHRLETQLAPGWDYVFVSAITLAIIAVSILINSIVFLIAFLWSFLT
ncbi:MAG: hypothetical protein WBB23_21940 [Desulforhopalus sp.]